MIRKYQVQDHPRLLEIFQLNTPHAFAPEELKDFEAYLNRYSSTYFILEEADKIIGCGGYFINAENKGRLSWDLLDPAHQGRGLGKQLILHCLEELQREDLKGYVVWTSQHAYLFYAKFGFVTSKIEKNYWGEGLDLYLMEKEV